VKVTLSYKKIPEEARRVITGTGRSGTQYTTILLKYAGVPTAHEWIYSGVMRDWDDYAGLQVDVTMYAGFKLPLPYPTALQVRDPLKVISSWAATGVLSTIRGPEYNIHTGEIRKGKRQYAALAKQVGEHLGIEAPLWGEQYTFDDLLPGVTEFYIRWNKMCEEHCDLVLRAEDLPSRDLADFIGIPFNKLRAVHQDARREKAAKATPRKEQRQATIEDIPESLRPELIELADHYGYPYTERYAHERPRTRNR